MDLLAFDLTGTLVGVILKMRYCGLQRTMNWMFFCLAKVAYRSFNATPAEDYGPIGGLAITRSLSRRGLAEGKQCRMQHHADPLLSKPGHVLPTYNIVIKM